MNKEQMSHSRSSDEVLPEAMPLGYGETNHLCLSYESVQTGFSLYPRFSRRHIWIDTLSPTLPPTSLFPPDPVRAKSAHIERARAH